MNVSEAVDAAKRGLTEVFKGEPIVNIGLEEIEGAEDSDWYITLGFNRSWEGLAGIATTLGAAPRGPRVYKIVHMSKDGKLVSIKKSGTIVSDKALVLDSNLLVLLVVGSADIAYVGKHKRLDAFTEADFQLLLAIIAQFRSVIVTPNTLTETWSLATQIAEPARTHIAQIFKRLAQQGDEQYRQSIQVVERDEFIRLGLTDSVLLTVCQEANTLLTTDLDLYLSGARLGLDVQNFNHLREAAGTI